MDIHKNARLTPILREELANKVLSQAVTLNSAAAEFKVTAKTAAKWVRRFQQQGRPGLQDRSSRPLRSPLRCPSEQVDLVERLRRQRWTGFRISLTIGRSRATVSRILRRLHLSRIRDLEPAAPIVRYEHAAPGDLLHLDIKKIGRSRPSVVASPATDAAASIAPAGSRCMSRSTTTPALPSLRSCPTRKLPPLPPSCTLPWTTMLDSASPSPACSPTTVPAIAPAIFANSASTSVFASASLVLTLHAPTVRPNASSRPLSGNGPTAVLTTTLKPALSSCHAASISTTGIARMLVWITLRPSAVPVSTGTTC